MSWEMGKQRSGTKNYISLEEKKNVTQYSGFSSRWCFKSTRGESLNEPSEGDPEQRGVEWPQSLARCMISKFSE